MTERRPITDPTFDKVLHRERQALIRAGAACEVCRHCAGMLYRRWICGKGKKPRVDLSCGYQPRGEE